MRRFGDINDKQMKKLIFSEKLFEKGNCLYPATNSLLWDVNDEKRLSERCYDIQEHIKLQNTSFLDVRLVL